MSSLYRGIYDLLQTSAVKDELSTHDESLIADFEKLSVENSHERLVEALTEQLSQVLAAVGEGERLSDNEKLMAQVDLLNSLLQHARHQIRERTAETIIDEIVNPPKFLRSIYRKGEQPELPHISLSQPWLFTAGKDSPALLNELITELSSCDHVDILVSFITVSGVRKIYDVLKQITATDAEGHSKSSIRVLTTTYIGATEKNALDMLARLPNCEVRVSLDGRRTRLHAKAWMFERKTGFGSAYVGSANLSGAALMGGLEWTVKFTQHGQHNLYSRAKAHFETLWEDGEFQSYDPNNNQHVAALKDALSRESGGKNLPEHVITTFFDITPKPFQADILEQLDNERAHGRFKNLLVAATGTGKTVMAAFDYRRVCELEKGQPRLLFIAHREEILSQSLTTYRQILKDANFGDLLTGRHEPEQYDHLFATVQSLRSKKLLERYPANHWQVVVVDECHHIAAKSFDEVISRVAPRYLLGLTATPERADNKNILAYFDCRPDGSPSVQMRLWNALDQQLLAPFEYYACDDGEDYRQVNWKNGDGRSDLHNILSDNDARAQNVVRAWDEVVNNIRHSRALAFCVDVDHARFMTRKFNDLGIPAALIYGESSREERASLPKKLASKEINVIVTVDLYNEGIDLPFVDTLLLLRPTQSVTLFQQQIGRGLRLHPEKESCLVLDFVGQHRAGFRFDVLYGALTGLTRKEVYDGVQNGFGKLPSGCYLQLQKEARESILGSLRQAINQRWDQLRNELNHFSRIKGSNTVFLSEFISEQQLELTDIYRGNGNNTGWTNLKRAANLIAGDATEQETYLSKRFMSLLHIDDPEYLRLIEKATNRKEQIEWTDRAKQYAQMLAYQVDYQNERVVSGIDFIDSLHTEPEALNELNELARILDARTNYVFDSLPGLENTPLKLHASYQIREILTAVGFLNEKERRLFREGVLRFQDKKLELLFVTLDKADAVHEGVAYNDYAISREKFHWQSQNTASASTPTGHRYIESGSNGWQFQIFIRENKQSAYKACGPVTFIDSHGERPMNITWELKNKLPTRLYQAFSVLR
ncbi:MULTISPECIES: DUF3427 domain-containing protein [Idiomarina]|jgi:superfamily II DNA or RNA helicase|uniref:DUF3427 domain-containing protein n=1 Tax=Idiomarina TaxID=135575 RepID=UPI000C0B1557|nr:MULTISPECIES: DUF3427 domain-containing protein [Idiomarina]MAC34663.1 ATP-dependent helicase [Haliea sp.]MAO67103.1 ATP-dependent helicase [Idiomarina sp.]MBF80225.1 ATP-dependent helicase [Idiomarina sp.]|tara:strand:- start:4000 stop:7158 length:3159 start_codon:yes stop_codon:yes gene_type:complete